jgi:hypothetical protein
MGLKNHVLGTQIPNDFINGGLNLHQYSGFPYDSIAVPNATFNFVGPDRIAIKREGTWSTPPELESEDTDLPFTGLFRGFKFVDGVAGADTDEVYLRYRMESKDAVKYASKSLSQGLWVKPTNFDLFTMTVRIPDVRDDFSAVTALSNKQVELSTLGIWQQVKFENFILNSQVERGIEIEIKVKVAATGAASLIVAGFMLNQGSFVGDFKQYNQGRELLDAQRYYEVGSIRFDFYATNAQNFSMGYQYKVNKRVTPSVSLTNVGVVSMSSTPNLLNNMVDGFSVYHVATATGGANFIDSFTAKAEL